MQPLEHSLHNLQNTKSGLGEMIEKEVPESVKKKDVSRLQNVNISLNV